MPDAVAGKARAKSRLYWWRFRPEGASRRECGPHIDRHPMGRCRCFLSQIVDGHTDYDTRRCGGPIGAIRGSQRLSSVIFHGFCPFSLRDAAQSLPRLLPRVDRLLWPFFVSGFVARGCQRVELRAKNPKKTECGCPRAIEPTSRAGGAQPPALQVSRHQHSQLDCCNGYKIAQYASCNVVQSSYEYLQGALSGTRPREVHDRV